MEKFNTMNRDIITQQGSDYILKLELLGNNNLPYSFEDDDELHIHFSDIKGAKVVSQEIDISEFENPLTHLITSEFLSVFTSNPIKYKLILIKPDITLTLLTGNIYREN